MKNDKNKESVYCLELQNVVKRFPSVIAVNHIDLKVKQGKIFSLLGPSGCGKTTVLRLIAGLEKMDGGDILIDGKAINNVPAYKRECSTVFQSLAVFPHMTVAQNIAYGLEQRKVPKNEIRKRIGYMLDLMQLYGMEDRLPAQLSGGQSQRVALARSLVIKPKILLLDEPLSSLDRKLRKEMQVELKRIQREVEITFLYVTHDQKVALSISDVIAVMVEGKLEQVGAAREIYEAPKTMVIAEFMGASNIFLGKVSEMDGEKIQLQTKDGIKIIAVKNKDIRNKEITGISVHPDLIELLPKGSDLEVDNIFSGRITEMIYQGDFVETKIQTDQVSELITLHLSSKLDQNIQFSKGEEVLVYWDARNSNILVG